MPPMPPVSVSIAIAAAVVIACMFLFVCLAGVVGVLVAARRKPEASLVSPLVRRKLNDDLDAAITKRTVDGVKRDWLEADGWELAE